MSDDSDNEKILSYAGNLLGSVFTEKVAHGRIREGFAVSWLIYGLSAIGLMWWVYFHPDLQSNITRSGCCFFVAVGIVGSLVQTNTDLEDQRSGAFSKWGSGWNLWGDNIISNQFSKFFEVIGVMLCLGGCVYYAMAASAEQHVVVTHPIHEQPQVTANVQSKSHTKHSAVVAHNTHHTHSGASTHPAVHSGSVKRD